MDARIIKTKKSIQSALIKLLQTRHLNAVTVSALCEKADINRNTFYSHYHTPMEVVEEIANELIDELDMIAKRRKQSRAICIDICRFLYEKRDVFSVLAAANCDRKYFDIAVARARNSAQSRSVYSQWCDRAPLRDYYPEFVIGGCIFVLTRWVETGMKESAEEMGAMIHTIYTRCTV